MAKKPTEVSIPVQNIYYLLSYAWDYINEAETIGVGTEDYNGLLDLFAKGVLNGIFSHHHDAVVRLMVFYKTSCQ